LRASLGLARASRRRWGARRMSPTSEQDGEASALLPGAPSSHEGGSGDGSQAGVPPPAAQRQPSGHAPLAAAASAADAPAGGTSSARARQKGLWRNPIVRLLVCCPLPVRKLAILLVRCGQLASPRAALTRTTDAGLLPHAGASAVANLPGCAARASPKHARTQPSARSG
jgi:hypothetical protein